MENRNQIKELLCIDSSSQLADCSSVLMGSLTGENDANANANYKMPTNHIIVHS